MKHRLNQNWQADMRCEYHSKFVANFWRFWIFRKLEINLPICHWRSQEAVLASKGKVVYHALEWAKQPLRVGWLHWKKPSSQVMQIVICGCKYVHFSKNYLSRKASPLHLTDFFSFSGMQRLWQAMWIWIKSPTWKNFTFPKWTSWDFHGFSIILGIPPKSSFSGEYVFGGFQRFSGVLRNS